MKKIICAVTVIAFILCAVSSFAEEAGKSKNIVPNGSMGMMIDKGEMVATQDGGVIVMAGNKLLKYDKDLKLVKEVYVKTDMEGQGR